MAEAQVTPLGFDLRVLTPLAHDVNPLHVGFASQQSDATHVPVAHVTPVNVSFKWFVPPTQEEEAKLALLPSMLLHVVFPSQQSDAAHVPVAHLTPVNVSFKWFVPPTQEEEAKAAPLPSMLLHVGFPSQQSDIAQVPVAHVPVRTSLR